MTTPRAPGLLRRAFALLVLLGLLAGCAEAKQEAPAPPAVAANQAGPAGALPSAQRALRITIETSVTVADLAAAAQAFRAAVGEHGGYVGEAHLTSQSASFEAHVPVPKLPSFRAAVARLGETTSDSEKAEDVTEQRADIQARLRNARAQEKRLLDLLSDKTGSLADVVAVEKELASVRETIERMEAQERLLEGQIANATVKVQLWSRHAAPATGPWRRIGAAAGEGIQVAGQACVGIVVAALTAGPTILILAALAYVVYRIYRAIARRYAPPPKPPAG